MKKAKAVRRAIRRLLLAAPAVPALSLLGCGPIESKNTYPLTAATFADGGLDMSMDCNELCATILTHGAPLGFDTVKSCMLTTTDAGAPGVFCDTTRPAEGREPPGLVRVAMRGRDDSLGQFFAIAAHLEAASVHAFAILARELEAHGAPRALVRAARRSAREERRHAVEVGGLARRYGASPARPQVRRVPVRTLEAIAIENAVEGCVRETYGAAVAGWQARTAADPFVRRVLAPIAQDELRHAELAWEVANWIEPKLEPPARRRVRRARSAAVAGLLASTRRAPPEPWVAIAGLPTASRARALTAALAREVWAES